MHIAKAKALIICVRKNMNGDALLTKCEKCLSDLVECIEYLTYSERRGGPKEELKKALEELRSQVWKINDAVNKPVVASEQRRIPVAGLTKARNRALKAIDDMERLLNIGRKC